MCPETVLDQLNSHLGNLKAPWMEMVLILQGIPRQAVQRQLQEFTDAHSTLQSGLAQWLTITFPVPRLLCKLTHYIAKA
jgi:hypothetical protein